MTAALEGGEWSAARPGRTLPPGKTRYPLYRRLGGLKGRSGRAEISSRFNHRINITMDGAKNVKKNLRNLKNKIFFTLDNLKI